MTKPAFGEDLETAGPRWKGGVEWTAKCAIGGGFTLRNRS